MKKWVCLLMATLCLSGCSVAKEQGEKYTEQKTETNSSSSVTISGKIQSVAEKAFELNGTPYSMEVPVDWKDDGRTNEYTWVSMESDSGTEMLMISSISSSSARYDFSAFVDDFEKEFQQDKEALIINEYQREELHTSHYSGWSYYLTEDNGMVTEYFFLETPTDYVIIQVIGDTYFFEENQQIIDQMVQSFTVHDPE